jgi:hypothetical protein
MRKSALLVMFGLSSFWIVRAWYKNGNSGIPTPSVLSRPVYAFGLLMLLADMLGNVAVVVGAMATVTLAWQLPGANAKAPKKGSTNAAATGQLKNTKGQVQQPKKPGVNP